MATDNLCHRILLAKNQGCKIIYCEECDVTELEIGAISLRLESESIEHLYAVLKEATSKLAAYKQFKNQATDQQTEGLYADNVAADGYSTSHFNPRRAGNVH